MFDIKNILIESIFLGFGFFIMFSSQLIWFRSNYKNTLLKRLNESAIFLVRVAGILYLLYWVFQILMNQNVEFSLLNRFDKAYGWVFWLYVLVLPILSQLFWVKKIQEHSLFRILIGQIMVFFSVVFSDHFSQGLNLIHHEYVGSYEVFKTITLPFLKNILFFGIVLVITYRIQNKKKTKLLNL